ncbi:hypothetical protein OG596_25200 [Streptomyces sp. NBC_01102]|uniref:hypothetical protein n=1 Tax=Streptomyces sp. NBC_01102 TaxID=2903749 RepID=UPI0038681E04|nr:hypothetical protein OG596_25200 [Streptomyces sp. NBC_01102]
MAALAMTLVALAPAAARADSGSVTHVRLTEDIQIPRGTTVELLRLTLALAAGEKRHLKTRLETTSSTTGIVGLTNRIKCTDSTGAPASVVSASARNHEGYDTSTYAIPGHLPIYADLLFTAPTAGAYTCVLYGSAYSTLPGSYYLTAVTDSTWLEVSDSDQKGAQWWQNPACESADTAGSCTYVGDGATDPDAWVFYDDGTPVHQWKADTSATAVTAQANVELTTCYKGTASCADGMDKYERGTNAVVDTRFEFVQLDTAGHTCRTHSSASRKTIGDDGHHYVAYFSLPSMSIDTTCGTRTFIMRVYIKHVSGQTVKIDGVQNGATSLTNGIAFNHG